jgi:hypothetical protein
MSLFVTHVTFDCAEPRRHEVPGLASTVLADPDGSEFCVAERSNTGEREKGLG